MLQAMLPIYNGASSQGMLSQVSENPRAYMETHYAPCEENIQWAGCSQLTSYGTYIKVL